MTQHSVMHLWDATQCHKVQLNQAQIKVNLSLLDAQSPAYPRNTTTQLVLSLLLCGYSPVAYLWTRSCFLRFLVNGVFGINGLGCVSQVVRVRDNLRCDKVMFLKLVRHWWFQHQQLGLLPNLSCVSRDAPWKQPSCICRSVLQGTVPIMRPQQQYIRRWMLGCRQLKPQALCHSL